MLLSEGPAASGTELGGVVVVLYIGARRGLRGGLYNIWPSEGAIWTCSGLAEDGVTDECRFLAATVGSADYGCDQSVRI